MCLLSGGGSLENGFSKAPPGTVRNQVLRHKMFSKNFPPNPSAISFPDLDQAGRHRPQVSPSPGQELLRRLLRRRRGSRVRPHLQRAAAHGAEPLQARKREIPVCFGRDIPH